MIHKIVTLVSVGKYRSYQASGDVAFKKLTLFYGDNGGGKTTLATVFRSLALNDPAFLRRRKSINDNANQAVQIVQREPAGDIHYTFNHSTGWVNQLADVEIFDIHFVNDNIYSGFSFTEDHKRQLHQFVIGAQGVAIQQQINRNKDDKSLLRQTIATAEQQIIQTVGNNLTQTLIPAFLAIPTTATANIDQRITEADGALVSANANLVIQTLPSLTSLSDLNIDVDFAALDADLKRTSHAIKDAALQALFTNHCNDLRDHSLDGPEAWLKRGFEYVERKTDALKQQGDESIPCPFCKQEMGETLDILNAYTTQFNAEFNALVRRLEDYLSKLEAFSLAPLIQGLNTTHQSNVERMTSWDVHLPPTLSKPVYNIISDEQVITAEYQSLITTLRAKLQNPSAAITTTNAIQFGQAIATINLNIRNYNQAATGYNNAITTFKGTIQTVAQAQANLDGLKRAKKRFDPAVVTLCTQLLGDKQRLEALERAYPQLVAQQTAAATTFFSTYKGRVNYYLDTVFKTPFKIDNVVHIPPQGRSNYSKIGYKLTIEGRDISFDPNQLYNAKDCLSEGDKSTIALALFLAKLDIDPGLNRKIVIFDDPLSSFDTNRRLYTVQILKELLPRIKQLVVLSHNEFFLHELSKGIGAADKKCLRIVQNYLTRASIIDPLNLDTLVEHEYFKNVKELEEFLQRPDITKKKHVLGLLRMVLEAHIRFKFYRQLSRIPGNNQTFGNLITALDTQQVVFRDNANRASIITKLKLLNGISCETHHGEGVPDYVALGYDPNTITEPELASFVTDTLRLIDDEL